MANQHRHSSRSGGPATAGPIIEGENKIGKKKLIKNEKKKARGKHEETAASSSSSVKSQEVEARVRNIEE